jgi:hypothetical protein
LEEEYHSWHSQQVILMVQSTKSQILKASNEPKEMEGQISGNTTNAYTSTFEKSEPTSVEDTSRILFGIG